MKNVENGQNIGELILDKSYTNQHITTLNLRAIQKKKVLFFISLHCVRCIDLLPEIKKVREPNTEIIIFYSGNEEDQQELAQFYQQKISIVSLSREQALHDFQVQDYPFCVVADANHYIYSKGAAYNAMDVMELIHHHGGNKFFKMFGKWI